MYLLWDHIIIGVKDYYSFGEKGNLSSMRILPRISDYDPINLSKVSDEMESEY